ncbi:Ribonuclease/ribotoxin [Microdochium bolleyi]|uniref:ribonuclease T1 n=1 Tax=Microdochium bolleyi TaxID=196109 RepID=A0A136IJA9_9PEZI|nr:Ribonuclease/ribotoxin [Microdochium bolleyi]
MRVTGFLTALLASATAITAAALPAEAQAHHLQARASGATCGSVSYSAAAITAAGQRACQNYKNNNTPGNYPHTFNNREGFVFATAGPYIEFPILKSGSLYDGGAPGPDRVIVNRNSCAQAGAITHTGANGNAFLMCKEDKSSTSPNSAFRGGLPSLGQSSAGAAMAVLVAAVL